MALAFRDAAAFEVVLRSGIVPVEVRDSGARVARAEMVILEAAGGRDEVILLEPDRPLPRTVLAKLGALGIATDVKLPANAKPVRCWAEALAPVRVVSDARPSLVVFVTPRVADIVELAAELVRLGCDRQELLVAGDRGFVRVVDPPTYTIVRAIDRDGGLRAFVPDPKGQDAVWCELGYHHPLASELHAERGTLLLVAADAWVTIPGDTWRRLDAALELVVPHGAALEPGKLPARRRIELRLSAGRRDVPSLWVIREGGIAAIDRLLEYLPEDVVSRLVFAVTPGDAPTVILRARTGRHPAPDLSLGNALEYAPLLQMPDVYVPVGALVEPPLRRERLRSILDIAKGDVMWLARDIENRIRAERIADTAFQPLSEWADYMLHANAAALEPWTRSSLFDFTPYMSSGREWADASPLDDDREDRGRRRRKPVRDEPVTVAPPPRPQAPLVEVTAPAPQPVAETPAQRIAVDKELAALEAEFVALDAPGDAPARLALLQRLGHAYSRLRRRRDADLCLVRAVWESPSEGASVLIENWVASIGGKPATLLGQALAATEPSPDDVRIVALLAARAGAEVASDPHRVQRWLDDHDGELDVRTLWLSRLGLARLAGGDRLGLAHTRDRVLARLVGGLPVERELPAFLRLAGRSGALGTSADHIVNALDDLARRFATTRRKRSPLEAPAANTNAYVGFILAHGFARVGRPDRARAFVAGARNALAAAGNDFVHAYLVAAFTARVEQALEGAPPDTPLAPELGAQLAALDRVARYKVDRLREASHILEPHERPDPIGAYGASQKDARGPEFAALREIVDHKQRVRAIDGLVVAAQNNAEQRARLLDGIFDVLLELPESAAIPLFTRAWQLISEVHIARRAVLHADALVVVGHFGRTELVPGLLAELATAMPATAGTDIERVLRHSLRALRRTGLRDQIAELLARAEHAIPDGRADALRARLALAAGLAYLGDRRAMPIFTQARAALGESMAPAARLELTRALALAYANAPLQEALTGITELSGQLKDITDNLGTNSHFCLAVLHFMESLVLGITSDDLALGEAGRRFIEDDEHLIRRRLHRDLQGVS